MKKIIMAMALLAICVSCASDGTMDMSKFIGLWEVDYTRTMEAGKNSPKYSEKDAERMPAMIKRIMATMKIQLTETEMIYLRGSKEVKVPYSVKSADKHSVTISVKQDSIEATVIFTLIDGEYMRFKSSGSDDMAYYVWKKGTEKKE